MELQYILAEHAQVVLDCLFSQKWTDICMHSNGHCCVINTIVHVILYLLVTFQGWTDFKQEMSVSRFLQASA